jgi:predicted ATPase with chaperone activity
VRHVERFALHRDALTNDCTAVAGTCVVRARERSLRCAGTFNSRLNQAQIMTAYALAPADRSLLEHAVDALPIYARSMHRILRVEGPSSGWQEAM